MKTNCICFCCVAVLSFGFISFTLLKEIFATTLGFEPNGGALRQRLKSVESDIRGLRMQNEQILEKIRYYQEQSHVRTQLFSSMESRINEIAPQINNAKLTANRGPSTEYEQTRRRLQDEVQEMWFFFSSQLRILSNDISISITPAIERLLKLAFDHKRLLMRNVWRLAEVDGYEGWRRREGAALSLLVRSRLYSLQNPRPNCTATSRTLACDIDSSCGFGCQMHTLAQCLLLAYATQRTLLLTSPYWNYNVGPKGWDEVFRPLTDTCAYQKDDYYVFWRGDSTDNRDKNVMVGLFSDDKYPFLPPAVPKEFEKRLTRLHGSPLVWWVSQFLQFLMRENPAILDMYRQVEKNIKLKKPYVGIHVRRTDKLESEASFHNLTAYMDAAKDYLMTIQLGSNCSSKRIYIASDDETVLQQAKDMYPDFQFFGNSTFSKFASEDRESSSSFYSLLVDLHFLSNADFLVCTFSSTFCRTAYALMNRYHADASAKFRSLDDVYYYAGRGIPWRVATMDHKASSPKEIDLLVGDRIQYAGNHWDGFSKGKNLRTKAEGLFPSHKVKEETEFLDFPHFSDGTPHK